MKLTGIFAAATTPFDPETGDVDAAGFRRNAQFLLDAPLAGLVLFGSTGEGVLVGAEERRGMLDAARELAGDRLVLVGTGAESTRASIRLARDAAAAGADAVLVQPPGFFRSLMTPDALFAHYTAVADASPVPVVLYQVPPPFRSVDLDLPLIAKLAEHANIVGVKDSTGDLAALAQLAGIGGGFSAIVGTAMVLLDALEAGASAGILALAAFAPHECTEVYRRWQSRAREEAVLLQAEAARLHRAVVGQYSVPGVKTALDILGMAGGPPRPPLRPLGAADRGKIEEALGVRRLAEAPPSRA